LLEKAEFLVFEFYQTLDTFDSIRPFTLSDYTLIKVHKFDGIVFNLFDRSGALVHSSTLFKYKLLSFQLGYFNYLTVGNCWTSPDYRGLGIYGSMLLYIVSLNKNKRYIVFVAPDNHSSVNGLMKIGFNLTKRVVIYRLFKFLSWSFKS
jgi:hypothetical protein